MAVDLSHLRMPPPQVNPGVAGGIQPISPQIATQVGARMNPIRPGDPGYRQRIPPPAPDTLNNVPPPEEHPHPAQEIVQAATASPPAVQPSADYRRLSISFGRKPGKIVVNI